jgi:DNA-directed RNA polymerase subunit beta
MKRMEESGIDRLPVKTEQIVGRFAARDIIDTESGEVLLECNQMITEEKLAIFYEKRIPSIQLLIVEESNIGSSLRDTLEKDPIKTQEDALIEIYKRMRPGDPPTLESAKALFHSLFYDSKRYDLTKVGRLIINRRLGLDIDLENRILQRDDFVVSSAIFSS